MPRSALLAVLLLIPSPVVAAPSDELLHAVPPDASLVLLVRDARTHVHAILQSPFAAWFPTTTLGKQLLDSQEFKNLRDFAENALPTLKTTRQEVLDEVLGDAVAFAFTPGSIDGKTKEKAVILMRPRKPEVLAKIIASLNEIQTKDGELGDVIPRKHEGVAFVERQKAQGGSEFYCFHAGLFAFSTSENEIKVVIKRQLDLNKDQPAQLSSRMRDLDVEDAAVVLLINPRALDAEMKSNATTAKPVEKRFLERFAEVWSSLEFAAVYARPHSGLDIGISLRFDPAKLPAELKPWLLGTRGKVASHLIPKDALLGFAGHARATELIELFSSIAPIEEGKLGLKGWVNQSLGPVLGRTNLPRIMDSIGPNWAVWVEAASEESQWPTLMMVAEISGTAEERARTEKIIHQAVEFVFQRLRVSYNARHNDQIELKEGTQLADGTRIKTLVNDEGFPKGFQPSFALRHGYLVLSTSPGAIERFRPVAPVAIAEKHSKLATLSGAKTRDFLRTHRNGVARFLAGVGAGDENKLAESLDGLAAVLELVDSAELISRKIENGVQFELRIKPVKPLK